jgi:hypothetical protein
MGSSASLNRIGDMRKKTLAAVLAVVAALAFASPALAGHGRSGSTIIAHPE